MSSAQSCLIEAKDLQKCYGHLPVIDGLSFRVQRGECCGVLGPNGAGKTTTLRMLLGQVQPDAGRLRLFGQTMPVAARQARRRIGVVPQHDNLDQDFTVTENLHVYGGYFGLSQDEVRQRIPRLLELVALTERARTVVRELSGGLRRRLAIARALINDPELLILDEPTTGLDPQIRQVIWQILRQLQQSGLTLILSTHYMEEAERLCDRLLVLDRGRLVADRPTRELLREHIEPQVLEVRGGGRHAWHRQALHDTAVRCEEIGEAALYYGENLHDLMQSLEGWPDLRYLHRPANLEDVFFRLTGRELRGE